MNRIDVGFAELQAFVAVSERLSFRAAAAALEITQPALSRRVDKLEGVLQVRLFERTSRRVALSEAGRQFQGHARAAIREMEMALGGISAAAAQRSAVVTVACVPSVANHVLPGALEAFARRFPNVRLCVLDESGAQVVQSVTLAQADFGVSFVGAQEADLDFKAIYTEQYVLAVRRDHPLAGRKQVAWSDLSETRLISLSSRSSNRILFDNALANLKQRPAVFCEVNHVTTALAMAAAGVGVTAVPALAYSAVRYPTLAALALVGPSVQRTLGLLSRKGVTLSAPAQALVAILEDAAQHDFRF
ncbi:LysR family transcriptional regulator [Massilia sp. S19_KUP03_FR1]|uniref:LysR family transcriptional regulator n=1 Tax=Massilia sp. S19_KUP03_FR1 TaxID=3025503 RepID=UPI002FCDD158